MANATVLSITGQAWAINEEGQRRELKPGDRLADGETLITSPGGSVGLSFDNGQQLHLDGDQQITLQDAIALATTPPHNDESQASAEETEEETAEATPTPPPQNTPPSGDQLQNTGHSAFNLLDTGHSFVRLKRIIETVPELAYHWEYARDDVPEWRQGPGEDDDRTPSEQEPERIPGVSVELQGAGPDGIYSAGEISPNGTVPALITLDENVEVGDTLVVTDKDGNVLLNRPVTPEDLRDGVLVEVPVEPGDRDVTVEATITTPQGNSDTGIDDKPVDNLPPELVTQLPPQADEDADPVDVDLGSYFKDNSDGPLTYEVEGLPPGLSYDPNTGKITGTIDKSGSQGGPGGDGNYPITVTVTDPAGNETTTTFEWQVDNPPPVANDDQHTIDEDTEATGNVISGTNSSNTGGGPDNDPDGDELKVTSFTIDGDSQTYQPGDEVEISDDDGPVGTITIDENGNYTFTPEQDWNGTVPDIGYTITDGEGGEDEAKLTITVTPVNDPPVAIGSAPPDQNSEDSEIIDDTEVVLDLPNLFHDVDGDELTYRIDGLPEGLVFDAETGVISGTIDRSASQSGDNGVHTVTIIATDPDGETAEHTFTWTVTNPEPDAVDDTGETLKSTRLNVGEADGVLGNDTDPDNDELFVQGVIGGSGAAETTEGVGTAITGEYGTLVLQEDGSYVYTPDLNNNTVWTLPEGGTLIDTFTYTVSDGEGGTDTAELVITIHGHSNTPPFITPQDHNDEGATSIDGHVTVHEKGLDDGTDPGEGHIAEGVIQISAMDGLASITVAGQTFTLEQLEGLMTSGATLGPIAVSGGTLILTDFDPLIVTQLGVDNTIGGELHYTYILTGDREHDDGESNNSLVLEIQLGVTDDQGASSIADDNKLIVNVVDDVPEANDDVNDITEDAADPVEGNVIDNDAEGADGAIVTAITSANVPANDADDSDGVLEIVGQYGTLTIHSDGSYTYTLDNTNLDVQGLTEGDSLDEVFTYTLTDGDGDTDDATLTITINGADDGVTVDVPETPDLDDPGIVDSDDPTKPGSGVDLSNNVVFESGLTGGSNEGQPGAEKSTRVDSSFSFMALDGLDADEAITIGYTDINGEPDTLVLTKSGVEALSGTPQTITTQYGELVFNGYELVDDPSDPAHGTIRIGYEYTLKNAPQVTGDSTSDDFVITVNDSDTDSADQTLKITIVDDAPVAEDDTNNVTEGAGIDDTSITTGNVIGGSGATDGDAEDTTGADDATVTEIQFGTDSDTQIAVTEDGVQIDGEYGTLTIYSDGSYTYELDNSNLEVQGLHPNDDPLEETFTYILTDGDGDPDDATLTINIHGQDDGVTITVPDPNDPDNPLNEDAYPDDPQDTNINDLVVLESGLSNGSSSDGTAVDNLVKVESSFDISALDGLDNTAAITFEVAGNTLSLSRTQVEALDDGAGSQAITTEYGELVLNGYNLNDDGTITISYEYTLISAPDNSDPEHEDDHAFDNITITAKDRDDDSDEQTLSIKIIDDAPKIAVDGDSVGSLTVDETNFVEGEVTATNADFVSGVFDVTEGADGATTTYSLEVADGTGSGLKDTATGENIYLYQVGDAIEGRVATSTDVAFKIEINANTGAVTLTQQRPVQHPDGENPDDEVTLNEDSIKLYATASDGDKDTVKSAGVSVGGKFAFKDDGPTLDETKLDAEGYLLTHAEVDEAYLSSGSKFDSANPDANIKVTQELPINYGADGAVAVSGGIETTGLTFDQSNLTELANLSLKSGTKALSYTISEDGHTITATTGEEGNTKDIFTITLSVDENGTPSYTFELQGPLDHRLNEDDASADNIVLPFAITATDGDGDSVSLKFKVEVIDDTPPNETRELEVDEDGSVSFSNADINTTTTELEKNASHGTVTIGDDGTITYEPTTDYRGEDSFTYTVTVAGATYERTVNITVNPVADKPLFLDDNDNPLAAYNYKIETPEDTEVSLGLKLPVIKDKGAAGQGEPGYTGSDYSELLGPITLTLSGDGYVTGESNDADNTALFTRKEGESTGAEITLKPKDGVITIVIVDDDNKPLNGFHHSDMPEASEADGIYYLTEEEYEAITAHPAEDRHENFKVEVAVTSYEVDENGKKLDGVDGATSNQTITVDVLAVTDEVALELKEPDTGWAGNIDDVEEGKPYFDKNDKNKAEIWLDEDTSFNLTDILTAGQPGEEGSPIIEGFKDTDGSESHYLILQGLPGGTKVEVNGVTYEINAGGEPVRTGGSANKAKTINISNDETSENHVAIELSLTAEGKLPQIQITPPTDFSGNLDDITVMIAAKDSDDDNEEHTALWETDQVALKLRVKPVADEPTSEKVDEDEDTGINFLKNVTVKDEDGDPEDGGQEIITQLSVAIPVTTYNGVDVPWQSFGFVVPEDDSNKDKFATEGSPTDADGLTITFTDGGITGKWTVLQYGGVVTITADGYDPDNPGLVDINNDLQNILKYFVITPPAHGSTDTTVDLNITVQDISKVGAEGDAALFDTETFTVEQTINVAAVPEVIGRDGDDNWVLDEGPLQMTEGYEYVTAGEEDRFFNLGQEIIGPDAAFSLSDGWLNDDGKWVYENNEWKDVSATDTTGRSEDTFALLTPYEAKNEDGVLDVNGTELTELEGSVFVYVEGTGKIEVQENGTLQVVGGDGTIVTLPFAGEPVEIPMQYLDSVQFKGPTNWSGVVKIKVEAGTIDYDEDHDTPTELEVSGEAWLTNLIVEPRADQVTLTVNPTIKTDEDIPTELYIQPVSTEGETFDITISGIPVGATITYWVPKSSGVGYDEKTFTATSGNTVLEINGFDASKQPTLTPPKDSNEPIELSVKAESVDTLEYINKDGNKVVIIQKGKNKTTLTYDKDSPEADPAETTETLDVEDTSHTLPINIEVQGVPDKPVLDLWQDFTGEGAKLDESADRNYKEYEEDGSADQSVATVLKVALKDLIKEIGSGETGVSDAGPDGSESITLRIADLPEGFALEGAGPALPGGIWVISAEDLDNVSIVVPEHYSGTVKFTVQPVVTENDNPSEMYFDEQNVSFKVNPVVDSILSDSTDNLLEDTIGKLSLSPVKANGDNDEFISQVRIKVSDVEGEGEGEGLTLYASEEGATITPEEIDGVSYYVFNAGEGQKAPEVWVKGPANQSGQIKLDIGYTVTDPVGGDSTDIDSATKTGTVEHTLTFAPVTDEIKILDLDGDNITGVDSAAVSTTDEVTTLTNPGTVKVSLTVQQQDDSNAGDNPDIDGSEQLTHVAVTGVPEGVSVKNAIETGTGQWLLIVEDKKWNGSADLVQELEFVVSQYAAEFDGPKPITITTYSKDSGAESHEKDSITWQLHFKRTGEGPDENNLPQVEINPVDDPKGTEDTAFSLNQVVKASIAESTLTDYNVTLTVRTTPGDGVLVSLAEDAPGITFTQTEVMEDGERVVLWTATKQVSASENGQTVLKQLLDKVQVTAPENDNSNNMEGPLELDINLAVHADGISRDDSAEPKVVITPVTDTIDISVGSSVTEGESIPLNISLPGETVDGELGDEKGWGIVKTDGEERVFVNIAGNELEGKLYNGTTELPSIEASQVPPADPAIAGGIWYAVSKDDLGNLKFVPDESKPHQTGSLHVTVLVEHQEKNSAADDVKVSTGTGKIEIVQSNSGYKADITAEGVEFQGQPIDQLISLNLANDSLVDDQETIHSAFIDGLPSGFTVWVGGTMASNGGGGVWVIPVESGSLPSDIAIKPPQNWSGTLDAWDEDNNPDGLKLTVMSGHNGLEPTPSDIGFDLVVNPLPDSVEFTPTLSFGDAGDKISLNLNAAMKDPSAATGSKDVEGNPTDQHTERTELTLTGFPDGQKVIFFIGDDDSAEPVEVVNSADDITDWNTPTAYFNGGTWTITGLSQTDLNNLSFLHAETVGAESVTVTGKTYEVDAEGQPFEDNEGIRYSEPSEGVTVDINVSATVPTSGDDFFLWDADGLGIINGFDGKDTIQLRFSDDLVSDDFDRIQNIEVIDMRGAGTGANTIGGEGSEERISISDILDSTGDDNTLTILGDEEDTVRLSDEWTRKGDDGDFHVYHGADNEAVLRIFQDVKVPDVE